MLGGSPLLPLFSILKPHKIKIVQLNRQQQRYNSVKTEIKKYIEVIMTIANHQFAMLIGAMKAGTTSLYAHLIQHPEICACKFKEPEYFSQNLPYRNTISRYEDLWDFDPNVHSYALEASTGYTKYPVMSGIPKKIYDYGLKPKFIYIVREPIERIESHYRFLITRPSHQHSLNLNDDHFVNVSKYYLQLSQYLPLFDKSSIMIIDFQELSKTPETVFPAICSFLGIDNTFAPQFTEKNKTRNVTVLESKVRGMPLSSLIDKLPRSIKSNLKALILSLYPSKSLEMSKAQRAKIHAALVDDMRMFQKEFGFDVSKWGF